MSRRSRHHDLKKRPSSVLHAVHLALAADGVALRSMGHRHDSDGTAFGDRWAMACCGITAVPCGLGSSVVGCLDGTIRLD
jgi:hypothetical protein